MVGNPKEGSGGPAKASNAQRGCEPGKAGEQGGSIPIGVPVSEKDFRRMKEEAERARPTGEAAEADRQKPEQPKAQ